jgi:hypothetical protein
MAGPSSKVRLIPAMLEFVLERAPVATVLSPTGASSERRTMAEGKSPQGFWRILRISRSWSWAAAWSFSAHSTMAQLRAMRSAGVSS